MSDNELLERVRAGDLALYGVLMRRYHPRLHAVLYQILGNTAEVDDAMQEAHLHAFTHLGQFAGRCSFLTWLTRIMIYEAFARLRRRKHILQLDEVAGLRLRAARDPEQQALERELRRSVGAALAALPKPYRQVVTMREIEEKTTADTARLLGITQECVRIRLHRGKALLRGRLRARGRYCSSMELT